MFKRFKGRVPEFEQKVPMSAFVIFKREASWLIAAFLLLCLLSFLAGYFMGQRKSIDAFVQQTSEDALLGQSKLEETRPDTQLQSGGAVAPDMQIKALAAPEVKETVKYYAPIAVNDSYGRTIQLVDLAHKHGVELRIKKSSRKLKSGRRKITHQIVTGPYADKEALKKDLEILQAVPQFKKISVNIRQINTEG